MLTNLADYNKRGAKEGVPVVHEPFLSAETPAGIRRSGRVKLPVERYDAGCGK